MRTHEHTSFNKKSKSLLAFAAALTAATFVAELLGGFWTNSVALLSDSGHVLMDLTALLFSLLALRLAEWPATDKRTFGLHRLEVFAAFLNGAMVTGVAFWILFESVQRFKSPPEVKVLPMLVIALLGLFVNLLVAWQLHDFAKKDINIRGAFIHVAGDALASLGVVLGGVLIHFTGYLIIDPLVGIFVAAIIVINAFRLLRDSIHILLEGVPKGIHLNDVVDAMSAVPGVKAVEDTHVWNICSHISSLSAHVVLAPADMEKQKAVTEDINRILWDRFKIVHSTIQIHSSDWKKPID